MKNALFLASAAMVLASSMSAGVLTSCPPAQSTVITDAGSTPQVFTCNLSQDATMVRYKLSLSFQDNSSGGPDLSVFASAVPNNALPSIGCLAIGATNSTDQTLGACTVTSDWFDASALSSFTVTVTGGPGSNPLPFNASASVRYETAEVPEPAAAGAMLIGGAALAMAGARRRRQR